MIKNRIKLKEGDYCSANDANNEAIKGWIVEDLTREPTLLELDDRSRLLVDVSRLRNVKVIKYS